MQPVRVLRGSIRPAEPIIQKNQAPRSSSTKLELAWASVYVGVMKTPSWMVEAFQIIDRSDSKGFAKLFAENGEFRFGNAPAVHGPEAVEAAVNGFFGSIQSLSHSLEKAWEGKDSEGRSTWAVEGQVTYTRKDGKKVPVPFSDTFVTNADGKVLSWRIFMDLAPLFQA